MKLLTTLWVGTGSQKSNMAAAKQEVVISQVLSEIETKFQMLNPHFWGPAIQWSCCQHCGMDRKSEIKHGGRQTGSSYISSAR